MVRVITTGKKAKLEGMLTTTYQSQPIRKSTRIKHKTIYDLKGIIKQVRVKGDINEPVIW